LFVERTALRDYFRALGSAPHPWRRRPSRASIIMSRVFAALSTAALLALSLPTAASAGCANCYVPAPQPCVTCYQQQVVPPQYRTYNETVMVPKTVMVEPEGVQYEDVPPQYATVQRTEMVAPARAYMVPVRPRCGNCGW